MNARVRLGVFAAVLAVVFGAAFGVGRLVGPDAVAESPPAGGSHAGEGGHGGEPSGEGHSGSGHGVDPSGTGSYAIRLDPYTSGSLSFKVIGPDGRVVTAFDPVHEKPLHLIVVRRDLSGFQHVHPDLAADGTWRVPLALTDGGPWRAYADFTATGGPATVLATDLDVPGAQHPAPLPAPVTTAVVDGYTVRLDLHDGVTFGVSLDGRPVTDLQPYLGAAGHLVAIAQQDLAYLHVHPTAPATRGPDVGFAVEGAASGTHRLYFQFRHRDVVHTAEFTVTGIGGGHAHN
ncbi:hypothetical protein ACFO1B_51205 [Dactylosporangium siamense]|uniref:Secreted protein n=1 Tax=Dactylosporangium siamense TaxID=685454 RepID=A0A919UH11_9ACTN|nr:hypothetical protein [Dactylosporangium siamense]GIG51926.1 hypothetical protein Dsi01nite_099670 [Dactylosporangium siamense]